ncbi:MAG: (S)-ureidoglycine aminohydrolase [Limisphaerales bacterium]
MKKSSGSTRTVVRPLYALLTPDGFVASNLPGWKNVTAIVNISPVMGARFSQMHITFGENGTGEGNTGALELFVFILEGRGTVKIAGKKTDLKAGGYVFIPPRINFHFSGDKETKLVVFQKKFEPLTGKKISGIIVGHEKEIPSQPFLGNKDARLQVLLPDKMEFDLAVNIFTYQPGATLPFVETHVMEHGLLMLRGKGIYRLDEARHPVKAGDVIWMASFCPQWFIATGKTPASYIYYKDVNRAPLGE